MDASFKRKEFVAALIEILSQGIGNDRLDDAEIVLGCVRALRPQMTELDTFEAWIAMKRGFWSDAIRLLHNVDANTTNWSLGKALLAFCQFATGDAAWSISANEVLAHGQSAEAVGLVRLLLNPDDVGISDEPTVAAVPQQPAVNMGAYLRA